ncbi:MAG: DUF3084 domain-containing protein [Negativicutes bacterium]|nr:DUF3084 domain-containing protein [Negativicutes bacterium]
MYGLMLIAVIAIMGGAIAYIGDKLGTKVGKKKLTIFGLRPKYTSIIVTIITGILISASTLGVLSLVSRDVRTALFGMDALKAQLVSLSQEVSSQNAELEISRKALEDKTKEYAGLNAKVQETVAKLTSISRELASVTVERDKAAAALSQVQSDYALARGDLDKAEHEITELQATKTQLDTRITQLNSSKISLEKDVDELSKLTDNLKNGLQFVREGAVVFRAGEVLYTTTLQSSGKPDSAKQAIGTIAYQANQTIIERFGIENKNLDVLWLAKSDIDHAVDVMNANPDESVIVRITATGNTIYGEPVIGQLQLFPNHLVYSEDSVVYSEVVDVGRENHQSEEVVLSFLQKVNAVATKQGILPDPIQGTVGSMSGAQLYETINKVSHYGGKVQLIATAKTDVHTVGPLHIEISVQKVQ